MTTVDEIKTLIASTEFSDRLKSLNELRNLEPSVAFPLIIPLVNDMHARIRYAAVSQLDTLGHVDLAKSLELLRFRLHHDSEMDVKAAAADAIAGLKLTEALDDLQAVYRGTNDWLLKFSIIASIGELGNPDAYDLLLETLKADNILLQTTAISALGDLGNVAAVPFLLPFVANDDWQIRHRLVQTLGQLRGEQATQALETLAQDQNENVAREAQRCIDQT
jgi:HEAT repeat protein